MLRSKIRAKFSIVYCLSIPSRMLRQCARTASAMPGRLLSIPSRMLQLLNIQMDAEAYYFLSIPSRMLRRELSQLRYWLLLSIPSRMLQDAQGVLHDIGIANFQFLLGCFIYKTGIL